MKENKVIKCWKGFDSNLKCKDFQYEVGKTYEIDDEESIKLCEVGFHAVPEIKSPLRVFGYYPPSRSRYCEVEISGRIIEGENKIVGSRITIVREIGIEGIVNAHEEWVENNTKEGCKEQKQHCNVDYSSVSNTGDYSSSSNTGYGSSASNTGYGSSASNTGHRSSSNNTGRRSSSSNTGDYSSASNIGDYSSVSNTGYGSSSSNTGRYSSSINTGYRSSSSNTGYRSSSSNTGQRSSASNTGGYSSASNTGDCSLASNTGGYSSAEVSGKHSVAVVTGKDGIARGSLGCAIVLTERNRDYEIVSIKAVIVDGKKVKADTWYKLVNGELKEVEI